MKKRFTKKFYISLFIIVQSVFLISCVSNGKNNIFSSIEEEFLILLEKENVSVQIDKIYDNETSELLFNQLAIHVAAINSRNQQEIINSKKSGNLVVSVNQRSFLKGVKYQNSIDLEFKVFDENNKIIFQGLILGNGKDNILSSIDRYKYSKKLISSLQNIWQK
ncbi:MAG: hypothetical protein J6B32_03800 [Spirochaetaceae bacterium]|nr:hypothetical protein [Spirochaetaceae bacterium]